MKTPWRRHCARAGLRARPLTSSSTNRFRQTHLYAILPSKIAAGYSITLRAAGTSTRLSADPDVGMAGRCVQGIDRYAGGQRLRQDAVRGKQGGVSEVEKVVAARTGRKAVSMRRAAQTQRWFSAASNLLQFTIQLGLDLFSVQRNLCCGNLFRASLDEAKFAYAQPAFGPHRRAIDAARHGAMRVEVTGQGLGIEGGAGFVIREVLKNLFCLGSFIQDSGFRVAGEGVHGSLQRFRRALQDPLCALRIVIRQLVETLLQTQCVQPVNGKGSNATLRAACAARNVFSAALIGPLQPVIENMQQFTVASAKAPPR